MSPHHNASIATGTLRREVRIDKADLRRAELVGAAAPPLAAGSARLRLDLFSLTANNVTYAAMGEGFAGYWDFFPAADGWGRLPVWGFATVVASTVPGVDEGSRYFGYYPLAETVDVVPGKVGPRGFVDTAPHRAAKAAVYNQHVDTRTDPAYDPDREAEQVLLRPLYPSGWWAADRVHQAHPRTVVISSASSKTALATAHRLRAIGESELVALTSPRNEAWVRETGLYARTSTYDGIGSLAAEAPVAYVDLLCSDEVTAAVHGAFGPRLILSLRVGATDWAAQPGGVTAPAAPLAGTTPELLFVPSYAPERLRADRELGAAMLRDMRAFYAGSRALVTPARLTGGDAILDSWARLVAGRTSPREGFVLSF